MAHNQRIFYACQAVAITSRGKGSVAATDIVYGAQSVGMSSTFTLDQVFELGQIEIYENVEEVADIEVTIEKVIDGYKLVFDLASGGTCKTDLVSASKNRCDVLVAVFDDGISIVCPAQEGKTETCGTCGFCWTGKQRVLFKTH